MSIKKTNKYCRLKDLLKNSRSYYTRQFVRTGATDEHIKVATWLQEYKWGINNEKHYAETERM